MDSEQPDGRLDAERAFGPVDARDAASTYKRDRWTDDVYRYAVGDGDLVVDGAVYDAELWESDGEGGVQPRLSIEERIAESERLADLDDRLQAGGALESALERAVAVYEAALQGWQGRDEEVAAGLAELPFPLSAQAYREQEAFAVAQQVIAERHPSDPSAGEADAFTYARDVERLRLEIASAKHSPPPPQEAGERHDVAEPGYGEVSQERDLDAGMSID